MEMSARVWPGTATGGCKLTFTVRNNDLCTQFSCVIVCVVLADISMRSSVCSTQSLGSVVYTGR